MRPVTAAFLDAIATSHRLAVLVEILEAGIVVAELETVIDGSVTLDQTAATRGRADITVVDDGTLGLVPTDTASQLAPYGNEIRVSRGLYFPSGVSELVALGVFRLDQVDVDDQPDGMQIRIAGQDRSARIIDARFEEPYQVVQGTNYGDAILAVLQAAWPEIPYDLTTTSQTTPALISEEGGDRWQFARDMAAAIGMDLYFNGDGTVVMRPVTSVSADPIATIAEGEDGVLLTAARSWNRQGTYNRVIATGENTGEAAPARGVATDDNAASPTYYFGPFGKVPRFYASPFITTNDQAADAAQAILSRELGTTQQASFGSLVLPHLEPDDAVLITRERAGIDETHILDQITIPLGAEGVMSGSTRAVVS